MFNTKIIRITNTANIAGYELSAVHMQENTDSNGMPVIDILVEVYDSTAMASGFIPICRCPNSFIAKYIADGLQPQENASALIDALLRAKLLRR